jgi:hypothetical protein
MHCPAGWGSDQLSRIPAVGRWSLPLLWMARLGTLNRDRTVIRTNFEHATKSLNFESAMKSKLIAREVAVVAAVAVGILFVSPCGFLANSPCDFLADDAASIEGGLSNPPSLAVPQSSRLGKRPSLASSFTYALLC